MLVDINVQYGHVEIEFWRKGIKLLNRWDEISTLNTPDCFAINARQVAQLTVSYNRLSLFRTQKAEVHKRAISSAISLTVLPVVSIFIVLNL